MYEGYQLTYGRRGRIYVQMRFSSDTISFTARSDEEAHQRMDDILRGWNAGCLWIKQAQPPCNPE